MAATDDEVEQKANKHPTHVVQRRRRGYAAGAAECEWEVEVLEKAHPEILVQSPLDKGNNGAYQEEEDEAIVELTMREQTPWSNNTPL